MAEDWAIDVKKYAPGADDAVIAAIVRHCGIALRNRDSSLVSFTDSAETELVRESYCRKKLGLTDPDSALDAAIANVGARMKSDTTRNRVTVYYLLAEAFGKLGLFGAVEVVAPVAVAAPPVMPAAPVVPATPMMAAAPVMAAAVMAPVAAVAVEKSRRRGTATLSKGELLPLALMILGGLGILAWVSMPRTVAVAPAPMVVAAAPVAPVAAIPDGAGIVSTEVEGKPVVSIYFDTAKSDIYPNFEARTEALRAWLAGHPDTHLQISGFNDPRGNAAFNAELSKSRAFAVRDSLAKLGVPVAAMDLVKPADTTDTADSLAGARRVDVTVEDGPVPVVEAAPEAAPAQP